MLANAPPWHSEFPLLVFLLWSVGAAVLARSAWLLRGTTLLAALFWAGIAWSFMGLRLLMTLEAQTYLHYVSGVLVVVPVLAALGAKRPQNGAWQFIVLTLVGVLLLPVLQGWAYGDLVPHVHPLFRWLIIGHVVLGVGNYGVTRYWISAFMFGCGAARIEISQRSTIWTAWDDGVFGALVYFTIALICAWLVSRRAAKRGPGLQRLWGDFRDAYGAVWALRVAERLNAAAKQHGWPVEFTWGGILVIDRARPASEPEQPSAPARPSEAAFDALPPEVRHRVERELRSMLRRFVSHEWIVRRLATEDRRPVI